MAIRVRAMRSSEETKVLVAKATELRAKDVLVLPEFARPQKNDVKTEVAEEVDSDPEWVWANQRRKISRQCTFLGCAEDARSAVEARTNVY